MCVCVRVRVRVRVCIYHLSNIHIFLPATTPIVHFGGDIGPFNIFHNVLFTSQNVIEKVLL